VTLFRSAGRRRPSRLERILAGAALEDATVRAQQQADNTPEPSPPRPRHGYGPDMVPRLFAPQEPVNPEWDPCGRPHPPLKTGSEGDRA
jgi:hypothetical protein